MMLNGYATLTKEQFAASLHAEHMPVVSLSGTGREQLVTQRRVVLHRLRDAWTALRTACPNGRDYADADHLRSALAVHRRRLDVLQVLMDNVEMEIEWVSE